MTKLIDFFLIILPLPLRFKGMDDNQQQLGYIYNLPDFELHVHLLSWAK